MDNTQVKKDIIALAKKCLFCQKISKIKLKVYNWIYLKQKLNKKVKNQKFNVY